MLRTTCKTRQCLAVRLFTFLSLGIIIALAYPLHGQVAGATLSGTVSDQSGAVIAGARVLIRNTATGATRQVTTGAGGSYSAPNLLAGTYEVTTSATGFSSRLDGGVILGVA